MLFVLEFLVLIFHQNGHHICEVGEEEVKGARATFVVFAI